MKMGLPILLCATLVILGCARPETAEERNAAVSSAIAELNQVDRDLAYWRKRAPLPEEGDEAVNGTSDQR
jgi:hypothetical protein